MKISKLLVTVAIAATVFSGCSQKPASTSTPKQETKQEVKVDAVTSASVVKDADAFQKAISKDGKWIIATLNDLTINKDLVLEGEFKNGKKDANGKELIQRKIALYTQDDKHNVTNRFTLTAPKLTIKSPMASIQHGTFKGDVYVEVPNFELVDAKVDGNIYFANEQAKSSFKMDAKSSVTGKQEIKK